MTPEEDWSATVHNLCHQHKIQFVTFVPDGGLKRLIELCQADPQIRTLTLTTEEEGVAFAAGAFLGGKRAILMMQSSGVGNCINMLSLPHVCNMPFVALVTMRGEWAEFNPWQVPMGQNTEAILEAAGVTTFRVDRVIEIGDTLDAALQLAFQSRRRVAVLLSQRLLGAKTFLEKGSD